MDKGQIIQSFWQSFGLPAYDQNTVPQTAVLPYITYSVSTGALEDTLLLDASIWYRSTSWAEITRKAEQIAEDIAPHKILKFDKGRLLLVQGTPFSQRMSDPDKDIRRIRLNVEAEFLSAS